MSDIVERLRETIVAYDEWYQGQLKTSDTLLERFSRERHEAADEILRLRAENEKLHREAAIRIDQIEREQEAHLKTMADLYYQAEMNARLLTENASFRGEIETLRRDVKTAVMGDSAELADVKRDNEKLRELVKALLRSL